MGKSLVIKGGNFAANGIPDLASYTDITSSCVKSDVHRQFIHYPNNNLPNTFQYNSGGFNNTRIVTLDVSSYVGRHLRVYTNDASPSSNYTGGCYWKCWASAVSVTLPWTGTTNKTNALTAVSYIDGTGTGTSKWFDLTVPTGAAYLVMSVSSSNNSLPTVLLENE